MNDEKSLFNFPVEDQSAHEISSCVNRFRLLGIFISIVSGVSLLLILIAGSKTSSIFSGSDSEFTRESLATNFAVIIALAAIFVALIAIVLFFIFRSVKRIKAGLEQKNQDLFNRGLNDLKVYFIITGVVAILGVVGNLFPIINSN